MSILKEKLKEHAVWAEGWRNFPYEDTVGKVTIGVGRNLDDRGLSDDEVGYILENDLTFSIDDANQFKWFAELNTARQVVVADMIFNMGIRRFRSFANTIRALERHDYETAAEEMIDSKWYRQVGRRGVKNVQIMREGRL